MILLPICTLKVNAMHELHIRIDDQLWSQLQTIPCDSMNELINDALRNYVRQRFLDEHDEYGVRLQSLSQTVSALNDSVINNNKSVMLMLKSLYALLSDDNSSLLAGDDDAQV